MPLVLLLLLKVGTRKTIGVITHHELGLVQLRGSVASLSGGHGHETEAPA